MYTHKVTVVQKKIMRTKNNIYVVKHKCLKLNNKCTVRPKLKLSLFALYRPTRKYPADSKDFIGKKYCWFFYWSRQVIVLLFIVYLPRQLQKGC